jgi:hypothetical protein
MVAALTDKTITRERIFSYHTNCSWNGMRKRVRELFPERPELVQGEDQDVSGQDRLSVAGPIARAEEILRGIGLKGFRSDEEVVRDFVADMFP